MTASPLTPVFSNPGPKAGHPIVWTAEGLGHGFSSVSVSDDAAGTRLFTMGDVAGTQNVIALDAADGTIVWRRPLGPR